MLLTNSLGDPLLEAAHIALLSHRRVDGLVISVLDETHPETLERLSELDIPVVVLDRNLPPDIPVSRVLSDHRTGMKAAALHLLDLGHRRIALIGGSGVRPALERRAGLEEAFAARDLPPTYTLDEGSFSVEHGAAAMRGLLDLPEPPTAVIAGGNQLMLGALQVVSERGVTLGSDLSFVGCDDVAITDLFQPAVAVVRRDNFAMGRTAAELLLGRLRDGTPLSDVVLPDGVRSPAELRRSCRGEASCAPVSGGPTSRLRSGSPPEAGATSCTRSRRATTSSSGHGARRRGRRRHACRDRSTLDLCILDDAQAARARALVAEAAGLPVANVAVGTTHNHSVPVTRRARRSLDPPEPRARRALRRVGLRGDRAGRRGRRGGAAPVRVGAATGSSPLAVNRRMTTPDGRAAVGLNPDGVVDRTLTVVRLDGEDDLPVATIVHYACHPIILGPDNTCVTPEYPGIVKRVVEAALGGHCLFVQGACGDVGPRELFVSDRSRLPAARRHARSRGGRHRRSASSWRGYRQRLREGEASAWIASFEYEPDAEPDGAVARRPRGPPAATPRRPRRPSCLAARGRALRGRGLRGACGGRPAHGGARAHRADEVRPDARRARRRARRARGVPAARPRHPARARRPRRRAR